MRLLLVEDSKVLQRTLGLALRRSGHVVDISGDGEDGLWLARSNRYDVVILDVMLPKMDGFEVLRALRGEGSTVHVLFLTARDAVTDRVQGLKSGADDYLVKPFSLDELLARVEALGRRSFTRKENDAAIGDLRIDFEARTVTRADRPVALTAREYLLLEYLVRNRNKVVSRTEIEAKVYDDSTDLLSNAVDSAICLLRRKITFAGEFPDLIRTRRGLGYVMGETTEDGR